MTVNNNDVLVTYDTATSSGMGEKNASVTYIKAGLAKEYGQYKDTLDQLIATGTTNAQQRDGASSDSASVSQEALNKTYTIAGHTFKPVWVDSYKSYILAGTNDEGEAGEWLANYGLTGTDREQAREELNSSYDELYGRN